MKTILLLLITLPAFAQTDRDTNETILKGLYKGLEYKSLYNNSNQITIEQDSIIRFKDAQIGILREAYRTRNDELLTEIAKLSEQLSDAKGMKWYDYVLIVIATFGAGWVVNDIVK